MKRILVLALSVNQDILCTHILNTWHLLRNSKGISYDLQGVVFTQGFEHSSDFDDLRLVRDDSHYKVGLSISEIRDYFTRKAIKEYRPDYILHCDDDFKFTPTSRQFLDRDFRYMESHPDVGVMCMYHCNANKYETPYDLEPSRVATRSGILIRTDAFETWGGADQVRYFEECVMAAYVYRKGYRVVHSVSSTIHITKSTGLGKSLEREYGEDNIPNNGRKILCDKGWFLPSRSKEDGSVKYSTMILRNSPEFTEIHRKNHAEKFDLKEES